MPGSGDTSLANLPEPRSAEAVAAVALAVERAAERRCSALARELRAIGSPTVAALLEELGCEHEDRAALLEARAAGGDPSWPDPAECLPRGLSETGAAACDLFGLTPYRAFAAAVDHARQAFQLYSYLAAAADQAVSGHAEQLAEAELARAARLRVARRRAYHAGRETADAAAYPAAHRVESEADLLAAALAIEQRLAGRLARAMERDAGLSAACHAARQGVEDLRRAAGQAGGPGGAMAEELAKFARSATGDTPAGRDGVPRRPLLADCERAFAFYDAVASAPPDEPVMLRAQDLSRAAVERIRQVRESAAGSVRSGSE